MTASNGDSTGDDAKSKQYSLALNQINLLIHSGLELNAIMNKVVAEIAQTIGADSAVVYQYEKEEWVVKYSYGFPEGLNDRILINEEGSYSVIAARQGKPLVINNAAHDERVSTEFIKRFPVSAILEVGLTVGDQIIGNMAIHYHNPGRRFSELEIDFINKAASTISLAMRNLLLIQEQARTEAALRVKEQKVLQTIDRLMILVGISSQVLNETTIEGTLNRAVEGALAVTDAKIATSGHGYKEGSMTIGALAFDAETSPCPPNTLFTIEKGGVYMDLFHEASTIRLTQEELLNHPRWWGLPQGHAPLNGLLGARLEGQDGKANGMLLVSNKRHGEFNGEDEALLSQLCLLTSLAIKHIEARQAVEKQAEQLQVSEMNYRTIFDSAHDGLFIQCAESGQILDVNQKVLQMYKYTREDIQQADIAALSADSNGYTQQGAMEIISRAAAGEPQLFEWLARDREGTLFWVEVSLQKILLDGKDRLLAIVRDITERKRIIDELRESEERFRNLADNIAQFAWMADNNGQIFWYNQRWFDYTGTTQEEMEGDGWKKVQHPDHLQRVAEKLTYCFNHGVPWEDTMPLKGKDGSYRWFLSRAVPIKDEANRVVRWFGTNTDITQQMANEEALRASEERLYLAQTSAGIGTWNVNLHTLEGTFSEQYLAILGIDQPPESFESFLKLLHPDDREQVARESRQAIEECRQFEAAFRVTWRDDSLHWIIGRGRVYCDHDKALRMTGVIFDVTERKLAEESLRITMEELARSNRELEQFAYVASHDLQEPLRMISAYVKLLERKYRGRLDPNADTYIHFAVDGAARMQKLIEGLLDYSRISRGTELHPVDTNASLSGALSNLKAVVEENDAEVTNDELPMVEGDETQLMQLFQNLIGNALKYRKADVTPKVYLTAERTGEEWLFSVTDNGIGIDPAYHEDIFQIFKRLHTQEEYQGTGIGLASCKKIVERHGGRIWLTSIPGDGSTFFFTLRPSRQLNH